MNAAKREAIFARLRSVNPEPRTELVYSTPFELLVAVILSAQATDASVNKATENLYEVANTPQAMVKLGEAGLKRYIKTIGLYNAKAANVLKTSEILLREHGGEVPAGRDALERLPGVGRKTANVILNTAFGEPTIAVDTHVFRVANRTRLAPGKDALEVERRLSRLVPLAYRQHAHHWLILHGRYTCTARKPRCGECPILDLCEWPDRRRYASSQESTETVHRRPPHALSLDGRGRGEGDTPDQPTTRAKAPRENSTDAESLFWSHVRAHRLRGFKFKRQQPIGRYIVDFVCFEAPLVVEVDGGQHLTAKKDAQRDEWLRSQGFAVLRFWNNEVLADIDAVMQRVDEALPPSSPPSPIKGEGVRRSRERLEA